MKEKDMRSSSGHSKLVGVVEQNMMVPKIPGPSGTVKIPCPCFVLAYSDRE
jgi:hypothetical protein